MSFYVTTPIYYVNSVPHVGHVYTTVVADTLARYRRLRGEDVFFLTGTDEHGQKIEQAAAEQGIAPIELVERVVAVYRDLWARMGMSNDDFIRTTEPRHLAGVEEIIERIAAAGDLYLDRHEGWYCVQCETYYTEKELEEGNVCPIHGRAAEWRSEENVFFRLSRYGERLLEWYDSETPPVRPASRLNEVRSFVESGLKDLSVSRANLEWGLPFPGYPGQTIYVWLDALTNYISALGFGSEERQLYSRFWVEPFAEKVHIVGKDILRFHAVYWPAFLMSAGLPLPSAVWAHGFWLLDDRKMSKSSGNVARPNELIESFGNDSLRYFLLRDMVFGQDATFSDEACIERFNSDLANGLGNMVSRLVTLSRKAFDGCTPPEPSYDDEIRPLAEAAVAEYREAMDELAFQRALRALWKLLSDASQYMVSREPWRMIGRDEDWEALSNVLYNSLEAVRIVAVGLLPVMPETAPLVLAAIGVEEPPDSLEALAWGGLPNGRPLEAPPALFPRIEKSDYFDEGGAADGADRPERNAASNESKEKAGGTMIDIEEFARVDLRVATIEQAEPIPKSNKLLKLTVDLGGETRTLVAGIAAAYEPEEIIGRQVVVVANLQPATLMGVESQGMVLAASVDGRPTLLHPAGEVPNGSRVR